MSSLAERLAAASRDRAKTAVATVESDASRGPHGKSRTPDLDTFRDLKATVHNRLLTPMVLDMASFAGLARPLRNAITAARHAGPMVVPKYGARYRDSPVAKKAVGRR